MTAKKHDFVCYQGADWLKQIGFKANVSDSEYISLTGWTFEMQIRSSIGGTLLHNLTPDISLNGTEDMVLLPISKEDTLLINLTGLPMKTVKTGETDENGNPVSITGPSGVYDLFSIDETGDKKKRMYGVFVIHQAVTGA